MSLSNLQRMIQLAEVVFAAKTDPEQLDVNQEVIERLLAIHPSSVMEYDDGNGPVAWVLVIPTTLGVMQRFLDHDISEKELFDLTLPGESFEAVYLCSALVLEEYRRKGITKSLALKAIETIRQHHSVKALFVWAFSEAGDQASETIAREAELPLYKRAERIDQVD